MNDALGAQQFSSVHVDASSRAITKYKTSYSFIYEQIY